MHVLAGTAIWEAAKTSNGGQVPADKSTWNQKVAGNNDPNVWDGQGSKGKDNALWDDVPANKEAEPVYVLSIDTHISFRLCSMGIAWCYIVVIS